MGTEMARVDFPATVAAVELGKTSPGPETIEVQLSLARGTGPVAGIVREAGAPPRSFHGWLELMDALERSRSGSLAAERVGELSPRADP